MNDLVFGFVQFKITVSSCWEDDPCLVNWKSTSENFRKTYCKKLSFSKKLHEFGLGIHSVFGDEISASIEKFFKIRAAVSLNNHDSTRIIPHEAFMGSLDNLDTRGCKHGVLPSWPQ